MFWRLFYYRIKVLVKNPVMLFWTFAFPVILGLLFYLAFADMDAMDQLETTQVGIVTTDKEKTDSFEKVLYSMKKDGKPIIKGKQMSEEQAKNALAKESIAGYYRITADELSLFVSQSGVEQTFMKEFLNQYTQRTAEVETLLETGSIQPQELTASLFVNESYVKEEQHSGNYSIRSFYFFTLVAMTVLSGFMWGLKNANDQQANQSANGIRLCMIPRSKLLVTSANMLAALTLFSVQNLLILMIFHFLYDVGFGDRWGLILVVCGVGSLASVSLGTLLGNFFTRLTYQQKISVGFSLSMAMSFFAGMMGSESLKYWIDLHLPILGKLNIVNVISDSLYKLFYYDSLTSFYQNLFLLFGFSIVFMTINFFFERRVQYDHL